MRRRPALYRICGIPGCKMRGGETWIREHEAQPHVACACGNYVGVNHSLHLARLRQYGKSTSKCREVPLVG